MAPSLELAGITLHISYRLAQAQPTQERQTEADQLFQQGIEQLNNSQPEAALQLFQQALAIYQELKNRQGEGQVLKNIGNTYFSLKEYAKTIEYQQQALAIAQELQDRDLDGISYYFLSNGAKAVMASLWLVNDASTSQLMQQFYSNLANKTATAPMTTAQALRQAQLSMLKNNTSSTDNTDDRASITSVSTSGTPNSSTAGFSHPYYWAPFILIGNGS